MPWGESQFFKDELREVEVEAFQLLSLAEKGVEFCVDFPPKLRILCT